MVTMASDLLRARVVTIPPGVTVGMVTICPALASPARLSAMTVTRKVLLRGGPVPPSALAWKMKQHGVEVEPWEAPEEDRGLMTDIVIGLIVNGTYDAIKTGLADFLATFRRLRRPLRATRTTAKMAAQRRNKAWL
jgi:hypothetical protein